MYRLLLADDSEAAQRIVSLAFREPDYQVICRSDGAGALGYASRYPVDLALIDVGLPGIDGYKLCGILQENPLTAGIPLVLLGSIRCPVDEAKMKDIQAAASLEKPFETGHLVALVSRLLRDSREGRLKAESHGQGPGIPVSLSEAVISAICEETITDPQLLEGLDSGSLQAETRPMPRLYLGEEEAPETIPGVTLSEHDYQEVADRVLEKLSGALRSVIPEAAGEVLGKNRVKEDS